MTVRHAPAASLPFRVREGYGGQLSVDASHEGAGDPDLKPVAQVWFRGVWTADQCRQHADYLVHAANTYPKLVAAVRKLHALGLAKAKAGELSVCERSMRETAYSILNELGEAP